MSDGGRWLAANRLQLPGAAGDVSPIVESKLIDHPACMARVRQIYDEMVQDRFESLVAQGLAGPSSASEYRAALAECLAGQKMTTSSDGDLAEGHVFDISGNSQDRLSIEVPIFSQHGCSDAFAVFRLRSDESALAPVYLYDILVP